MRKLLFYLVVLDVKIEHTVQLPALGGNSVFPMLQIYFHESRDSNGVKSITNRWERLHASN